MREGMNIGDLAAEIQRIETVKRDFIVPAHHFGMDQTDEGDLYLEISGEGGFGIRGVAHEQLARVLGIPKKYYDRMRAETPLLLIQNVNAWLERSEDRRMLRTLDGDVRAVLSDRFRPLDNYMVAQAALPILLDAGDIEIKSSQITERRLYIQAVTPRISGEVREGETIQAGIVISNSEVGLGSFRVELLLFFLACVNGMIGAHTLKRHHVGRRLGSDMGGVEDYSVFQPETIEADNNAFMLMVRDMTKAAFDEKIFQEHLTKLKTATEREISPDAIQSTVKEVTKRYNLAEKEGEGILGRLAQGGDLSQYGLAGAVTNLARDMANYDRGIELERLGGQIIDLPCSEWQTITKAA